MSIKSALKMDNATGSVEHPYYPVSIEVVGYLANELSVPVLLGIFAAGCGAVVFFTLTMVRIFHPRLSAANKGAIMWFVICTWVSFSSDLPCGLDQL
jgi:cholestenol delta-isomerase